VIFVALIHLLPCISLWILPCSLMCDLWWFNSAVN